MISEFNKSSNILVLASIIGLAVGLPQIFLSTFTVFVKPLITEFSWSRSQISLLFSVVTITIAIAAPLFSKLIQRFGIRTILASSIILLAVSLATLPLAVNGFRSFLFWVVLIGFVGTGTTTFPYLGVFPSWFSNKLGIALGVAAAGIGIGQMIFPIAAQYFISEYGWRTAYQILAVTSLVIALPGALTIIRYKNGTKDSSDLKRADGTLTITNALSNLRFWFLAAGFFTIPMIAAGCTIHAMPIILEKGLAENQAARIVALGGLSLVFARVCAGFLLDWIGAKSVAIMACIAAALAPLAFTTSAPMTILALAPLLYGLALGIEGDLMPFGIRNVFGTENVTKLYGLYFAIFNLGVVVGPLLMGLTYDRTGSYDLALKILSVSALVAIPFFIFGLSRTKHLAKKHKIIPGEKHV